MVGLKDLNKSINNVISRNFPEHKIYAREITEGFYRPSFFTQIVPLRKDYETVNYESDHIMVAITYFNKDDTELENIETYDKLVDAFGMSLEVNERSFVLENIDSKNIDGALQFSFELNYWSQLKKEEKYEVMRELENRQE